MTNESHVGVTNELVAAADLSALGFVVFIRVGESGAPDLYVYDPESREGYRIEVKTLSGGRSIVVPLNQREHIDLLAIVHMGQVRYTDRIRSDSQVEWPHSDSTVPTRPAKGLFRWCQVPAGRDERKPVKTQPQRSESK